MAEIEGKIAYYPYIEKIEQAAEFAEQYHGQYILFGEYGLSPFLLNTATTLLHSTLCEIVLSNKNRRLFATSLLSAHAARFSGAVIASGVFEKSEHMPMPVFDLDCTQALLIAIGLKKSKTLPQDFLIGVRAASESEIAELRARKFIELGADFVVLSNAKPIPGMETQTMFLESLQ